MTVLGKVFKTLTKNTLLLTYCRLSEGVSVLKKAKNGKNQTELADVNPKHDNVYT